MENTKFLLSSMIVVAVLGMISVTIHPALAVSPGDYVVVDNNGRLLSVTPTGTVSVVDSSFRGFGIAIDSHGNYIVTDITGGLRSVTPTGTVSTIVSSGLGNPTRVAIDSHGNYIVVDSGGLTNGRLLSVTPTGTVSTIVSSGFYYPGGLAIDSNGNYIVTNGDFGGRLLSITPSGAVTTITTGIGSAGGIAIDSHGNYIVATNSGFFSVTPTGTITPIPSGLGSSDVAIDSHGNYIVTSLAYRTLSSVTPTGTVTVIAPSGVGALTGVAIVPQSNNPVPVNVSTTSLSSSSNPSTFGQSVSFTAAITPSTATGTVTFTVDGTPQPSVTVSSGQATFSSSSLSVGSHTITAAYSGDTNDAPSTSTPLTQTVNQITTTTTLASSSNPSTFGQSVTLTATVSPSTARGTVTFSIDGTTQPPVALSGGQASFSSSSLSVGSHTVTVAYSGDTNDAGSTASVLTQVVNQVPTTTIVSSSANPSIFGNPVTFTATVSPNTATGTVTFSIDGTPQAPVIVSGGTATLSTSSLSVGNHTVTAAYSGDTNDLPSTSTLTQTVKPIPFSSLTAKVHIEDNYTHFELESKFTLGTGSSGFNQATDSVSLQVGTFSTTIPTGSFKHDDKQYKFEGVINGVHIEASIKSLSGNIFELKAEAEHANLAGTVNPVPVQITIGNNSGMTTVNAKIDVEHDHNTEHDNSNE